VARRIEFELNTAQRHVARVKHRKWTRRGRSLQLRFQVPVSLQSDEPELTLEAVPGRGLRANAPPALVDRYGELPFQVVQLRCRRRASWAHGTARVGCGIKRGAFARGGDSGCSLKNGVARAAATAASILWRLGRISIIRLCAAASDTRNCAVAGRPRKRTSRGCKNAGDFAAWERLSDCRRRCGVIALPAGTVVAKSPRGFFRSATARLRTVNTNDT